MPTPKVFRIIQSIPSPKDEPFKRRLAKAGYRLRNLCRKDNLDATGGAFVARVSFGSPVVFLTLLIIPKELANSRSSTTSALTVDNELRSKRNSSEGIGFWRKIAVGRDANAGSGISRV